MIYVTTNKIAAVTDKVNQNVDNLTLMQGTLAGRPIQNHNVLTFNSSTSKVKILVGVLMLSFLPLAHASPQFGLDPIGVLSDHTVSPQCGHELLYKNIKDPQESIAINTALPFQKVLKMNLEEAITLVQNGAYTTQELSSIEEVVSIILTDPNESHDRKHHAMNIFETLFRRGEGREAGIKTAISALNSADLYTQDLSLHIFYHLAKDFQEYAVSKAGAEVALKNPNPMIRSFALTHYTHILHMNHNYVEAEAAVLDVAINDPNEHVRKLALMQHKFLIESGKANAINLEDANKSKKENSILKITSVASNVDRSNQL